MNKPNFEACQLVASKNINLQEMRVGRVKSVFTKTEEEKVKDEKRENKQD